MYVLEPQIQVRSDCLVFYNLPTTRPGYTRKLSRRLAYSGKVSGAASKRIRSAIDILCQITPTVSTWNPVTKKYFPFKLNFVTLTVSSHSNIDGRFGYENLMKPFLRKMRNLGNFEYVWKAELQKRGQLHYHLVTNTFLPWSDIRNTWNNLQRKNRLLDDYAIKNKHYDANSTDVHAINGIGNLSAYLAKYLAKENGAKLNGKVWDCSTRCKRKRFAFTPTHQQEMQLRQLLNDKAIKVIELDHCTIFKGVQLNRILTSKDLQNYSNWMI